MSNHVLLKAITAAFDVWTAHTDIEFVHVADAELAQVRVGFGDTTKDNEFAFPGEYGGPPEESRTL